jgi:hypothetical protein
MNLNRPDTWLSRFQGAKLSVSGLVLLVLTLITIVHGTYRMFLAQPAAAFDYAKQSTPLGVAVDELVENSTGDTKQKLSEVEDGYCRYVIVASSVCPFSKQLAVRWTVAALRESRSALLPEEWRTFWVFVDPGPSASEFTDPQFPAPRFRASHNRVFMTQVGITGFPYHLVLDRHGRVVDAGTGGQLYEREAFRSNCTLRPTTNE